MSPLHQPRAGRSMRRSSRTLAAAVAPAATSTVFVTAAYSSPCVASTVYLPAGSVSVAEPFAWK